MMDKRKMRRLMLILGGDGGGGSSLLFATGTEMATATFANRFPAYSGAVWGRSVVPDLPGAGVAFTIMQEDAGGSGNRNELRLIETGILRLIRVSSGGGTDTADLGTVTAGTPFAWGLSRDADGTVVAGMSGGTAATITQGSLLSTTLRIFAGIAAANPTTGTYGPIYTAPTFAGPSDLMARINGALA